MKTTKGSKAKAIFVALGIVLLFLGIQGVIGAAGSVGASYIHYAQTGETFTSALIRTRMSVAAELLRDRRNRIYSVAEAVGYNNAENFCRAFKKFYGKTPQEYRTL